MFLIRHGWQICFHTYCILFLQSQKCTFSLKNSIILIGNKVQRTWQGNWWSFNPLITKIVLLITLVIIKYCCTSWIITIYYVTLTTNLLPSWLGLSNRPTAPLQRGKTPPSNECPGYDTKQSDGEVPVMLELWRIRSTPSLPLLSGSLWPRVVVPDRVLSMGQIELNCVLILNWIVWNKTVFDI